jgi:hypothetical protein
MFESSATLCHKKFCVLAMKQLVELLDKSISLVFCGRVVQDFQATYKCACTCMLFSILSREQA